MHLVRALTEGAPQQGVSTAAQVSQGTTAAVILAKSVKRKGLIVQNSGLTVIKINLGTTLPTQTAYHIALKACSLADDGTGAIYIDDSWIGPVSAISSAAGGTFVVTEITAAGNASDWDRNADWYGT